MEHLLGDTLLLNPD